MWWMAFCLIVMCLIEQKGLEDTANAHWFNIFSLCKFSYAILYRDLLTAAYEVFEMVSAYGTVGLSLGIPTARVSCLSRYLLLRGRTLQANFSFSGALYTGSKVVLCAVMLRGRHRGLPMSLDRAIMLPHEFDKKEENPPVDGHGVGSVKVLRSPTKNTVERSQESSGCGREMSIEKS
jgi:hypothetical protein